MWTSTRKILVPHSFLCRVTLVTLTCHENDGWREMSNQRPRQKIGIWPTHWHIGDSNVQHAAACHTDRPAELTSWPFSNYEEKSKHFVDHFAARFVYMLIQQFLPMSEVPRPHLQHFQLPTWSHLAAESAGSNTPFHGFLNDVSSSNKSWANHQVFSGCMFSWSVCCFSMIGILWCPVFSFMLVWQLVPFACTSAECH